MKRNKHLLLWSSLGTLLLLMAAAYDENVLQEWRVLQRQYRSQLPAERAAAFSIQLRQVVVPTQDVADRCISCHLGMAPGEEGISDHRVFGPHPTIPHDPMEMGCTVCHGGQGRATTSADAHGDVHHWPEPMVPVQFATAGCGSCHTHLVVPNTEQMNKELALLERYDCLACHRLDKRGGTLRPGGAGGMEGPQLSNIGQSGFRKDWYEQHITRHDQAQDGPWRYAFDTIPAEDRKAIESYLYTRVGAPDLVQAKALFHSLGCRGCHSIAGVGGDDGPELTSEGLLDPGQLDFSHVPGEHTVENWLKEHFRSPAKVVPNSLMPILGLNDQQIHQLTFYMLSLRRNKSTEGKWTLDRVRAERLHEREFATDGATLFQTFCAACHGPQGQGMRYPGMPAFPAIGNEDFLAIASDDFLRLTIQHGRPGRRMPAWGDKEGGLRPEEIENIIDHLRTLGGNFKLLADDRPSHWVAGQLDTGKQLFTLHCAACHGSQGEGLEGPALSHPNLLSYATDTYLFETIKRGRTGTTMPAFGKPSPVRPTLTDDQIESLVTFLRSLEITP